MTAMRIIEIDAQSPGSDPEFPVCARQMYDLLGSNMTALLGHDGPDWRTESEFRKWEEGVLLDGLPKGTFHILLVDGQGLRGFLTFTAPPGGAEIYINEIEIRPSSRKDGVTFRRLMERFAARIETLPHRTILTYANRRNTESQQLILRLGFEVHSQTERGTRYTAAKAAVLNRLGMGRPNNGMQRTGCAGR